MPKSQFAQNLDAIQATVQSFLKPLDFRKKARVHNRRTESGLVQVISFQMGQFPIGDNYVIPGFRENLYGKFAINLGVLLPCVYQVERQKPVPDFIQEYDCTIRQRLGTLAFGKDEWFEITDDIATLATNIVRLLDKYGLEFLEQFKSYENVLRYFQANGKLPFQSSNRASLEAALIAHHIGNETLSKTLFAKARDTDNKGFQNHVTEIEKRVDLMLSSPATKN
ncbi:MAG TPA: DUF4304 domain-containing protein [Verrucomicrobiae bacterium]